MKEFWVDVRPWRKELATAAIESGADVIVADSASLVKALCRVRVAAPDGDLVPGKDLTEVRIEGGMTIAEAERLAGKGYVVVETGDWRSSLENLVALSDRVIAAVRSEERPLWRSASSRRGSPGCS
jgi:3-dehydroquinate synthase II